MYRFFYAHMYICCIRLDVQYKSVDALYTKPYTRAAQYITGVWAGYFLSKVNRQWRVRKVSVTIKPQQKKKDDFFFNASCDCAYISLIVVVTIIVCLFRCVSTLAGHFRFSRFSFWSSYRFIKKQISLFRLYFRQLEEFFGHCQFVL